MRSELLTPILAQKRKMDTLIPPNNQYDCYQTRFLTLKYTKTLLTQLEEIHSAVQTS